MADEFDAAMDESMMEEPISMATEVDSKLSMKEDDSEEEEFKYGCQHYKRKCQLVCPKDSCGKVYTCRFCHDEEELSHEFNRYEVKEVVCLICEERQPVAADCRKCSTVFGKYFCSICNLYNDEDRHQYHCNGCGLCRVGPAENFFHCDTCDMCFPVKLQGKHKCIERASRCPCAVCLEDIHTARTASHIPPCGHLIHQPCFEKLINTAHYTCPICNVSMIEMKAVWKYFDAEIKKTPMPPEYENSTVVVLCRDCHEFSTIPFHFMGLKCGNESCGGYNTSVESRHGLPGFDGAGNVVNNNNNNNNGNEEAVSEESDASSVQASTEDEDDLQVPGAVPGSSTAVAATNGPISGDSDM